MLKIGYYRNEGLSLAWDLGVIFQAYQILQSYSSEKFFFFNLGLKGVKEKYVGLKCFNS